MQIKKVGRGILPVLALGVGVYFLLGKKLGGKAVKGAPVKAGEFVSAQTFTIVSKRTAGMAYAAATKSGALITFTPTVTGTFTRNVVSEGGRLWAEIKRS